MYSPWYRSFQLLTPGAYITTTVLGRLGGSAMFFKHLIIWKFARVHLQNAGWHSIFTLLWSSANVRHNFFILHVRPSRSVTFRADTSSMHCSDEQKFTRSPKISFFSTFRKLHWSSSNKMAACLTPGRKETGAEVASFPPFSPLATLFWPITTKIELTRTDGRPFGEKVFYFMT